MVFILAARWIVLVFFFGLVAGMYLGVAFRGGCTSLNEPSYSFPDHPLPMQHDPLPVPHPMVPAPR